MGLKTENDECGKSENDQLVQFITMNNLFKTLIGSISNTLFQKLINLKIVLKIILSSFKVFIIDYCFVQGECLIAKNEHSISSILNVFETDYNFCKVKNRNKTYKVIIKRNVLKN